MANDGDMLDPDEELRRLLGGDEGGDDDQDDDEPGDDDTDDDEDLQDDEEAKHQKPDKKNAKQRYVTREEMARRDETVSAEKLISAFSRASDTTETMKELVPTYLDPTTGLTGVKNGIERLKAKAAQIDAAAQARIDSEVEAARQANAALFRGAPSTKPFRANEGDEAEKDFQAVATRAPDAKEAGRRMLSRSLEGWNGLKIKLPR